MKGILTGMGITFKHFVGPKTVVWYPYEKKPLAPKMRGLIKLVRNEETGNFNCEACLFCEKICPPQCITISYKPATDYRPRHLLAKNGVWWNFKRPVRSLLSHEGRPERYVDQEALSEEAVVTVGTAIAETPHGREGLIGSLQGIQSAIGYLPRPALERLATVKDVPLSDVYGAATSHPEFRLIPQEKGGVTLCQCPSCYAGGISSIAAALREELGGAAQGLVREEVICGADEGLPYGDAAPVLKVDGQIYRGVRPEQVRQIVREKGLAGGGR